MSKNESSNNETVKRSKANIHVSLSDDCKMRLETDAELNIRKPGQQIEYILGLYYSVVDKPEFQALFKS